MEVDYIIVGFGLAGLAFVAELEKANKSFIVIDDNLNKPSRVVGGMYNPIILKRFTPAWHAHEMWQVAHSLYLKLESKFSKKYIFPLEVRRILQSIEEQNNWVVASDKAVMSEYMNPNITTETVKGIKAPYGFGKLKNVGRVAGEMLLEDYKNYLKQKNLIKIETFDYNALDIKENQIIYKKIIAKKVVFSEGSYVDQNPFFNYLPMQVAKGELLVINVPDLTMDFTLKSSVFMVPYGDQHYVVGATYNWQDKSFDPTATAQKEIEEKLKRFLDLPYRIVDTKVGIRPTVKDRRPLVGQHPKYANLAVLNGLGTRGVIIAPAIAKILFNAIENHEPIPVEMNILRFKTMYKKSTLNQLNDRC